MKNSIQKIFSNDFNRNNIIFFIGSLAIAGFNYIYYPILSRLVTVPEFGEIQAVISLFMQLGIVLTAFGYVITNIISNTKPGGESNSLILRLEQFMLLFGVILFVVLMVLSYLFQDNFKLHSILPVLLVGVLIVVNIPATSRSYILQGKKRLTEVSIGGIIFSSGKLFLTGVLVWLITDNILAAVLAYIAAQLVALGYLSKTLRGGYVRITTTFSLVNYRKLSKRARALVKFELIYGLVIVLILSGLTLFYTSDTILARLFFDPHTLGVYSGISSIARIVFFITASVAGVLIASVNFDTTEKENNQTLVRSLMIVLAVGGVTVAGFCLFPKFFINLLVGDAYLSGEQWLPMLAIVMLLCSVNNLLATYQIALRRYYAMLPVLLGVLVLIFGLIRFNETPTQFIFVLLAANAIACLLLIAQIMLTYQTRRVK